MLARPPRPGPSTGPITSKAMVEKPGIYAIIHKSSGRRYVGSASNLSKRWHRHRKDLNCGMHRNAHLQASWDKYGSEAFSFMILELTSDLTIREQYWIDYFDSYACGFNKCPVARSSRGRKTGHRQRESARAHMLDFQYLRQTQEAKASRVAKRRSGNSLGQKLTWEQVCEIRQRYGTPSTHGIGRKQVHNGGVSLKKLAAEYGVGMVTIYDVVKWRTWKTEPGA